MVRTLRIFLAGAMLLFFVFQAFPACAAKYALIVGINDYINYSEEDEVDLSGCENDAVLFKDLLVEHYGFKNSDIITLLSQDATKKNIQDAFQKLLIDRCSPGDTAVFYYSGHGTYFDDYNGDEEDGYDEGLCAADMDDYTIDNYIVDDEFGDWISRVKTDNFTIVLDCCYSGTATKDLKTGKTKFFKNVHCKGTPGKIPDAKGINDGEISGYTLITGCAEDQISMEDEWTYNDQDAFTAGVMTINLIDNLYNSSPGVTDYKEVMEKTITTIKSYGYEQDPQLAGNYNRPVFGFSGDTPDIPEITAPVQTEVCQIPYILVTGLDGKSVELAAGFSNKITAGSLFEVYPPGEVSFSGKPAGLVQITSVSMLFSEGVILEGTVNKNGRALQVARNFGDIRLNLYIENKELRNVLTEKLSAIDYVFLTDTPEICDRIISGNVSDDKFYVNLYTRDGREIINTSGKTDEVIKKLRPYLDNAYAIKELSLLSNPSPPFNIALQTPRGPNPAYKINEVISFQVEADRDCYLTLIDVSTDGSITILFPNEYNSDNKIEAGRVYDIPAEGMDYQIRVTGPPGNEMVKAIATEEPLAVNDLVPENKGQGFKFMEGNKGGSEFVSSLPAVISKSLDGSKEGSSVIPVDGWSTAEMIISIEE